MELLSQLNIKGFKIIESIYTQNEIRDLLNLVGPIDEKHKFGLREFLKDHPTVTARVFTPKLKEIIRQISPNCDKVIKSIYFNKPPVANWSVAWHQDLTINVAEKQDVPGFKNWRPNPERTVVQPSMDILQRMFTIRIHLDTCTIENGALRVIEGSHYNGVINMKEWMDQRKGVERICEVKSGGILIMKPLLLHASKRTENKKSRRVIHLEFYDQKLPGSLEWKEELTFK